MIGSNYQKGGSLHMTKQLGKKETEIMDFLHSRIFDPILQSPHASEKLKQGVRGTVMRMKERDAAGMVQYYWSAIVGTERSIGFAALMRQEGFSRFEEALEEFRVRFNDDFLR
jgi:hypothetical protein